MSQFVSHFLNGIRLIKNHQNPNYLDNSFSRDRLSIKGSTLAMVATN